MVLSEDLFVTEKINSDDMEYDYSLTLDKIKLPINAGDKVGNINVIVSGKKVKSAALTIDVKLEPLSFWQLIKNELFDMVIGKL